ncbi:hypothetical protein A1O3_09331 [Capronia epimyces CBS 606.96]|uniref:Alpha/beta hydrolase fold-3 domain-containing protein n=1 Tax=Capronia epimyces CBS 606.96 TaxID=1182542 RepID=W9XLG0_9EURO|nr:uncharacterized protein A1O3_09331 [Capronia epimyces CBS 606.96]EXJ78170.1 hypothetical protein A1O3_09331 [Capronia epimyces CBS 606.96]
MTVEQIQSTYPSTANAYLRFAQVKGFDPHTTQLIDGTKVHWIGSEAAEKVIVHFHGGGYVFPATISLFHFMWDMRERATRATGSEVSVVVASYDLAPAGQYPRQLQQGIAVVEYMTTDLQKQPANMIISGNSAGGNLAMGVISHLLHPHPSCVPLTTTEAFAALLLMSPWISMCYAAASYGRSANGERDVLHVSSLERWANLWKGTGTGPADHDAYTNPYRAPPGWWAGLGTVARRILITAGAQELMVDDICAFGHCLLKHHSDAGAHAAVQIAVAADESHDQAIIDLDFGFPRRGESARCMMDWVQEVFSEGGKGTATGTGTGTDGALKTS